MSGLLESTLGAVGQAGEAIDKVTGGRALRGALAGKPRELASFVPFSDTMGLTDVKDKTSGRDLTDAYGATGKNDHSFGAGAAGFLADNILSPANLLGGAAAFKAAPTVAKGIVGAGKAISGLDLIDHLGSGAKALGSVAKALGGKLSRQVDMPDGSLVHAFGTVASDDDIRRVASGGGAGFGRGDEAAFKYPVTHKPIDTDAVRRESLPANASRPRRWSSNPAEKAWYSADRGRRYSERMTGREIPGAGEAPGVPPFNLLYATTGGPGTSHAAFAPGGRTSGIVAQANKTNDARAIRQADYDAGNLPWQRAFRIGPAAGFPTKANFLPPRSASIEHYTGQGPLAWYTLGSNDIGLNTGYKYWSDNELMDKFLREKGPGGERWFSSSAPDTLINHEVAHGMHRTGLGRDEYANSPKLRGFADFPGRAQYLKDNLSEYSATNPHEAVAETIAALRDHRWFEKPAQEGLSSLLRYYGGEQLWQNLGDQKLLKPLGYSLLGALGVGGAAAQERWS